MKPFTLLRDNSNAKRALLANGLILVGTALFVVVCVLYKDAIVASCLSKPGAFERFLSRSVLLIVAGQLALTALLLREQVHRVLECFFTREDYALNLAILRIVVFALLLIRYGGDAEWYAGLPESLRFPPFGVGRLVDLGLEEFVYFTPQQVEIAYGVFLVFCVTGLLGFFSRTSAFVVAILAMLPLAAPEFYGKVSHGFHHVIWFAALLSVSRCGDALALDAVIRIWRHPYESARLQKPALAYGLPFCFVWLLIGMIYFFPGFWKAWERGYEWVAGDQLKFIMQNKWFDPDGWSPPFRLDRYPLLYRLLGLGTIFFELLFILLIFTPRTRLLAAVSGLGFHAGTYLLMQISFYPLVICYVVFFDWHRILRHVGRRFFPEPLRVSSIGGGFHHKAFAMLDIFDVLGSVKTTGANARSGRQPPKKDVPELDDVCAVVADQQWFGTDAYRETVKRIPLLWPVYPIFWMVFALSPVWKRVHPKDVSSPDALRRNMLTHTASKWSLAPLMLVACILIAGNAYCGLSKQVSAWPFTCHPTFSGKWGPLTKTITLKAENTYGQDVSIDFQRSVAEATPMSYPRVRVLMQRALGTKDNELRQTRLEALWDVLAHENHGLESIGKIEFYRSVFRINPDIIGKSNPLVEQVLLYSFEPEKMVLAP